MQARSDSITLLTHRGITVSLCPPPRAYFVYLLHFSKKIGDSTKSHGMAGHYTGMTGCLDARLHLHRTGRGARLMKAVVDAGIDFTVARLWKVASYEDARDLERTLKRRHDAPGLCPCCQHRPTDDLVFMRQGHRRLTQPAGKRQPTGEAIPRFVRR